MAESDNVIRAGLTPKFKDVDLLLDCLNYEPKKSREFVIRPKSIDNYASEYNCPAEEFAVECIHLPDTQEYMSHAKPSGSIMIVLECVEAKCDDDFNLVAGKICFFPAGLKMKINNIRGSLTLYRAYVRG